MNFRTKIWMLPLCAATLFLVGTVLTYGIGLQTSSTLERLRTVEAPYEALVTKIDRATDQFKLQLQTAAAEGDESGLKKVEDVAAGALRALEDMRRLSGKEKPADKLGKAFESYRTSALGATRALLGKGDSSDHVKRMQTSLIELERELAEYKRDAAQSVSEAQDGMATGVKRGVWASLATGVVVLLVLGIASRAVIASIWRDLGHEPAHLRELTQRIAAGDLAGADAGTTAINGSLHAALMTMLGRLNETVAQIRRATDTITTASTEIAAGNQNLSSRTESAAGSLQQTASAIEELTGTVRHSTESARQANQLARTASEAATRGGGLMTEVVSNMDEINQASRKINEIIGVIDGIAFQTNILALNAAVEAARAGEQGRGFSVVASEVRSLAQRSATAAKEIKSLIQVSSEKVAGGSQLVQDAGQAMQEIVSGVKRVTDIIGEISAASGEQAGGIENINSAVSELDRMTQQNASLVEQSGSAAESLRQQASRLAESVSVFRLKGGAAR